MSGLIHPTAIIEPGAQLGESVAIGAYAYVGNMAVIGAGTVLHHHANVEGRTTIGEKCEIFPFARIGAQAMLGGMSKIVQDVPPFVIADGNPAVARSINKVGLERNGFTPERLEAIKQAFRIIYRSGHNRTQALERLREHKLSESDE